MTGPTLYERGPILHIRVRLDNIRRAIRRWRWEHFGPWVTFPVIDADPAPTTAQEGN